jgi:hypothetical protein
MIKGSPNLSVLPVHATGFLQLLLWDRASNGRGRQLSVPRVRHQRRRGVGGLAVVGQFLHTAAGVPHATPHLDHRPRPKPSDTPRYSALDKCLPRDPILNREQVQNRSPARHFVTSTPKCRNTRSTVYCDIWVRARACLNGMPCSSNSRSLARWSGGNCRSASLRSRSFWNAATAALQSGKLQPAPTRESVPCAVVIRGDNVESLGDP